MIGLVKSVWGMTGGRWLLGGALAALVVLSGLLAWERHAHKNTRTRLTAMTALRDAEAANHRATKAAYAKAQAAATLEHEAVKLAVESHWKGVVDVTQIRLRARLDAALAAARRVRPAVPTGARSGGATGQADPAATAPAAAPAGGAGAMPQLDERDVLICTENTIKAQGWRAFYEGLGAVQ